METESLTEAFENLQQKLHASAYRILKDEAEAQDAVQDTFCNLWHSASKPSAPVEAKFKLFAVLRNVCLNKIRRKKFEKIEDMTVDGPLSDKVAVSPATETLDNGFYAELRDEILSCLPENQRKIFEMSVFGEMEYEMIALRLGMTVEAVRMGMSRARKRTRERYQELKEKYRL